MNTTSKYTPFIVTTLLMWVTLYIIYPHYQYYIDPDGTAYLTISQRYANCDFHTAVNGYWSPWSCWLTALLIKSGGQPIPSSVIINTLGATGFLFIAHSFFVRFNLTSLQQWLFNSALAIFLCYAVFAQSFDDLWECFFLLSALRIMLADGFIQKPMLWVSMGVIGALSYFAKAYSFPFFIVNTICCAYLLSGKDKGVWIKVSGVSIAVMLVCSLPWIYALYSKYGIWTTSTAGTLNMSWYLIDHPYWMEGINILVPPVHPGSPYYWEDPYLVNGVAPHFWDSWQLFAKQVEKLGLNSLKLALSILQLSFFFPLIIVFTLIAAFGKKGPSNSTPTKVLAVSFLLFPTGYFLINYESRYLWYMLVLSMVLGGAFLQDYILKRSIKALAALAFSLSLIAYPVWKLRAMYDDGKAQYLFAQRLKAANIKGTIVSGMHPRVLSKIAYFSGNSFYFIAKQTPDTTNRQANTSGLFDEINKYHIDYYIHDSHEPESPDFHDIFNEQSGLSLFPVVYHEDGTTVYKLH